MLVNLLTIGYNNNMEGKELKAWRIKNKHTQRELAETLGVTIVCISRWENGKRSLPKFLELTLKSMRKGEGPRKAGRPRSSTKTERR
jgi:DNA-binding transcriptional regulator YiaG